MPETKLLAAVPSIPRRGCREGRAVLPGEARLQGRSLRRATPLRHRQPAASTLLPDFIPVHLSNREPRDAAIVARGLVSYCP